jgi:hypothetical protein
MIMILLANKHTLLLAFFTSRHGLYIALWLFKICRMLNSTYKVLIKAYLGPESCWTVPSCLSGLSRSMQRACGSPKTLSGILLRDL